MNIQSSQNNIFEQACQIFLPNLKQKQFYQITGGVNNWTKGLKCQQGDFVIRVYNNGKNLAKVYLQHQILLKLEKIQKSFKTPEPLRIPGKQNQTIGLLKEGYPCCVIKKIQGKLPKQFNKQGLVNFGSSVAQLLNVLQKITLSKKPSTKPYFDLYGVYYTITKQKFYTQIAKPDYDSVRPSVNKLLEYIALVQAKIQEYHKINLPMQLIHGDIHSDNILVQNNKIEGILDFQFVAQDWRAMDYAISISKFANQQNFIQILSDFNQGYQKYNGLTQSQLLAVPWLIVLRLVSNFVYFVGRVIANQESIDFCKQKVLVYHKRIDKIMPNIQKIQQKLLKVKNKIE